MIKQVNLFCHHLVPLPAANPSIKKKKKSSDQTIFPVSPRTNTETRVIFEVLLKFLLLHRDSKTFLSRSEGHQPISLGSGDKVQKTKRSSQPGEERPAAPASVCLRSAPLGSARLGDPLLSTYTRVFEQIAETMRRSCIIDINLFVRVIVVNKDRINAQSLLSVISVQRPK